MQSPLNVKRIVWHILQRKIETNIHSNVAIHSSTHDSHTQISQDSIWTLLWAHSWSCWRNSTHSASFRLFHFYKLVKHRKITNFTLQATIVLRIQQNRLSNRLGISSTRFTSVSSLVWPISLRITNFLLSSNVFKVAHEPNNLNDIFLTAQIGWNLKLTRFKFLLFLQLDFFKHVKLHNCVS